jgi:DNA-binding IscR family transcriptional regulator
VISHRGAVRGHSLARPAATITVREILEAIEGQGVFEQCIFWTAKCSQQRPSSLRHRWATIRPRFWRMLDTTALDEFAAIPSRTERQR